MVFLFSFFLSVLHGHSQSAEENISAATIESFNKMFNNVENARWHATDDGSTVKFQRHNIDYHVFFNKRGKWRATIHYVPPENLPKWVIGRVRSEFRNSSIFFAQHIRTHVGWTYFVKIEKGKEWKSVRISPEVTEVLGEYVRN
jgi:hypothetical protein